MAEATAEVHWAPRLSVQLIRRLYESEARGLIDEDLVDEVGIGLFARCESILRLTDAYIRGRVECPVCGYVIATPVEGRHRNRQMPVVCPDCGWSTTWLAFKQTFTDKRLHAGNAEVVFREYVARYPATRSAGERMLLVDWLLHEFHKVRGKGESGMAASNLLQGTPQKIVAFLDELAGFRPDERSEVWRRRLRASGTGRRFGIGGSADRP